jgi:hypothetical protein
MGDRANVAIIDPDRNDCVVLYSHWGGERLALMAHQAMATSEARSRWSDASYLRRIVFQHILDHEGFGETGWGISTYICDNEHPVLVIDVSSQRVAFRNESLFSEPLDSSEGMSFDEFVDFHLPSYYALYV